MLTLKDICRELETGSVMLRGRTCDVKALTSKDTRLVREWFPRPMPPLAPDPNASSGGSLNPKLVPNEMDGGYQTKLVAWNEKVRTIECAMALGFICADGTDRSAGAAWGGKAFDELHGHLSDQEIARVAEKWTEIAGGLEEKAEEAAKNS